MFLESGQTAPSFTLANREGSKIALKDLTGRGVVLNFYPRNDTLGCTMRA